MGNVLKIDRMSLRELSLRDEKIGKVWFWIRNNRQKSTTLHNSWPLYMANKIIFLFYFIDIFYVSKIAIVKCPSVTSRRDTFGLIKIDFFSRNFGSIVEVCRFLCVNDT